MSVDDFLALLRSWSRELFEDNPDLMASPDLLPSGNVIDPSDVELFARGCESGLVTLSRGGRFNTVDRPVAGGRWSLLSRSRAGGWYNAEYLPQIAAYVASVLDHGFDRRRVMFELPPAGLQLDLAILDDHGAIIVLGEAKRAAGMLDKLVTQIEDRFTDAQPSDDSKKRGDEARQLAWRLWATRAPLLWLIAPGDRRAFACNYEPLQLDRLPTLPHAKEIGLDHEPEAPIGFREILR